MIIDAHHHYPKGTVCPYVETYAEALEEIAEKYGVSHFCLLGLPEGPSHFGNAEIVELARRSFDDQPLRQVAPSLCEARQLA